MTLERDRRGGAPLPPLPRFAVFCSAYGRRDDDLASRAFEGFARRHLAWRLDAPGTAQLTSLLSSPEVAPSHAWLVPVGTHEGAVEVGWDLERFMEAAGPPWTLARHTLRTHMAVGDAGAGRGVVRIAVLRGPTEALDGIDKLVDAWWSGLEGWDQFRGAVLYRETEEGRSNLALEVAWLGPWADLQRMEREAVGALEPAARRLSVSVWHFRVSALHEGPGEDRERIRRLSP